jgi:hypothetical protein
MRGDLLLLGTLYSPLVRVIDSFWISNIRISPDESSLSSCEKELNRNDSSEKESLLEKKEDAEKSPTTFKRQMDILKKSFIKTDLLPITKLLSYKMRFYTRLYF